MPFHKYGTREINFLILTKSFQQYNIDAIDFGLDLPDFPEIGQPCNGNFEINDPCQEDPDEDYNIHGLVYRRCKYYSEEDRIQMLR